MDSSLKFTVSLIRLKTSSQNEVIMIFDQLGKAYLESYHIEETDDLWKWETLVDLSFAS